MSVGKPSILIATANAGKLAEFDRLLGKWCAVDGIDGLGLVLPDEGTDSYRSNAEAKAEFVARATGRLTIGDDSGIEISALEGRPGIVSARYAGQPATDSRNIAKVLEELDQAGGSDRSAKFVCWLALADSSGILATVEGICSGTIASEPSGANGFGYDPIFVFETGQTMAELSDAEKDLVSHRGSAVRNLMPFVMPALARSYGNG